MSSYVANGKIEGASILSRKPVFDKALYRCTIDGRFLLKKFHLSGILLIKSMHDSSTRVVFQNEAGFPFFDFEWSVADSFKVISINEKMNRAGLIKVLRKDFDMVLMKELDNSNEINLSANPKVVPFCDVASYTMHGRRVQLGDGFVNYYWDEFPHQLLSGGYRIRPTSDITIHQIQNFGKRLVTSIKFNQFVSDSTLNNVTLASRKHWIVTVNQVDRRDDLPATITITHHRAHFTIQLDRLPTPPNQPEDEQQPE